MIAIRLTALTVLVLGWNTAASEWNPAAERVVSALVGEEIQSGKLVRGVNAVPEDLRERQGFDRRESSGLFVGIRRFQDVRFAEIPYAADDAVDLAYLFAVELDLIDPRNVILSLSGEPQKEESRKRLQILIESGASLESATQVAIYRQLERQGNSSGKEGVFVLALATHGFNSDGSDVLVASDSLYNRVTRNGRTGIGVSEIFDEVSLAGAMRRLVLVDACRERLTPQGRSGTNSPGMGEELKSAISLASGQAVLSCTTLGGYCYDDDEARNGVFTAAVIEGLRGAAESDAQGFITTHTLAEYLNRRIVEWVRRNRRDHVDRSKGISRNIEGPAASMPLAIDAALQAYLTTREAALAKLAALETDPQIQPYLEQMRQVLSFASPHPERVLLIEQIQKFDFSSGASARLVEHFKSRLHRFPSSMSAHLEALQVSGDLATGILANGEKWNRSFNTSILSYLVVDLDSDGRKEALLGFGADGERHSSVVALDSKGEEIWSFNKEPNYPYGGARSGRFKAVDLHFLKGNEPMVVVAFNDSSWYPSALVLLDTSGRQRREFWHPGQFQQTILLGDLIVSTAYNNDLDQLPQFRQPPSDPKRHVVTLFALKPELVYGQAPPYGGSSRPNTDFAWYLVLSDRTVGIERLEAFGEELEVWISCGLLLRIRKDGELVGSARTDNYNCRNEIGFARLTFSDRP